MKQSALIIGFTLLCFSFIASSQNDTIKTHGIFYKFSLATTLAINEDYGEEGHEDETLLLPSALFVNNTLGYQFDQRTSVGLNLEYNWHSKQGLHFFPAYLNLQHNLSAKADHFFVRAGYGILLQMGNSFEKGNMFKLGLGTQGDIGKNNSILIGLEYTRKRFGYRTLEGLSSVSIFLEFMFL
ncbi:hypothetical protein ACS386_03740 [Flavobacteriaceae bacterium LMO-SS05]